MRNISKCAAIAVVGGVAVASLAGPAAAKASAAKPPAATTPAAGAAAFLIGQFKGKHHDHLTETSTFQGKTSTFPLEGATADSVLSLDAAGVGQAAAARATKWLEGDAVNYIQIGEAAPNYLPGSLAKLLLVAEAQHVDPQSFGGVDLIGELVSDEGAGGAKPGQYQDPNPDDQSFASTVLTQSLAVLALSNTIDTASQPSTDAISFLAGQACGNGSFVADIRDTTAACVTSKEDVDSSAYAAQALIAAGDRHDGAATITWLKSVENSDGGWGTGAGQKSNANSTAIAVEALLAGHQSVTAGQKWLVKAQLGCSAAKAKRGAVNFQGKYDATQSVVATSQAGVPLAGKPLAWSDKNGAKSATPVLACPALKKK